MCLGIPMRVLETDGFVARCAGRGEERPINLLLVGEVEVGAWVLVHLDSAQRVLEDEEVTSINNALDALDLVMRGENVDHLFADILAARAAETDGTAH